MNPPVNRRLVEQLLEDETLSYNEVAERAACSSWSVRKIARELAGDERPMKRSRREREAAPNESLGFTGWAILAGIGGFLIGAFWLFGRGMPPPDA